MGADLITAFAEIERNKVPDWIAAENRINTMSLSEMEKILGYEYVEVLDDCKDRLMSALESVKCGWEGYSRIMTRLNGVYTDILLAGDTSWGDEVKEVTDLCLFIEACGKEAGFITEPVIPYK